MNDDYEHELDDVEVDEYDIADEVSLADTGRRWVTRLGQREGGAAA